MTDTTSQEFFESKYRSASDPWQFATSHYERNRYYTTLKALEGRRYERAFEPGCSIGVLTEMLAGVCGRVEAIDISPTAVERARQHCSHRPNVSVNVGRLPECIPEGTFDLIVLSEIGYYFEKESLLDIGTALLSRLRSPGTLLAAHWLGTSTDHLLSGDEVHQVLGNLPDLQLIASERNPGFRLDRWERQ